MAKPYIGIQKIWYGDPLTADISSSSDVESLTSSMTEITNVHNETWDYSQDDPSTTDYVNQLTGKVYYRETTDEGAHTIAFTLGVYNYADKAALQGGEVISDSSGNAIGWKSNDEFSEVYKAVIALTRTGNYVVFSNACIIGKVDKQERNLGLGISAVACENDTDGVAAEYWFEGS